MKRKSLALVGLLLALALCLSACETAQESAQSGDHSFHYGGSVTLRILSGSENQELESILDAFARQEKINIEMTYQGSLDIMRALQADRRALRRGLAGQQPVAFRGRQRPIA